MLSHSIMYLIIPCYNEEHTLPLTAPVFLSKIHTLIHQNQISDESRILFVNDCSTDLTWQIIQELAAGDEHYMGISLSHNQGQQNSLLAGLMEAKELCDIAVTMDCDGQDDIDAIERMLEQYHAGYDVVYGVRSSRKCDNRFKRMTAAAFYRLMSRLGAEMIPDHAEYRLMSSKVLHALADYKEVNLFLRGLIPLIGFPSTTIPYERKEREGGTTHYTLHKMLSFALDGITSLSMKPIRIITALGILFTSLSFVGLICFVLSGVHNNNMNPWMITICVLCFLGGIQLTGLGIIGEYIGKTYLETKARPRYIINERTCHENGSDHVTNQSERSTTESCKASSSYTKKSF